MVWSADCPRSLNLEVAATTGLDNVAAEAGGTAGKERHAETKKRRYTRWKWLMMLCGHGSSRGEFGPSSWTSLVVQSQWYKRAE